MRLWIFSDLHRDAAQAPWMPPTIPDVDLAVVAGDVGEGLAGTVSWLAATVRPFMPVVLVPGNHEFYGGAVVEELDLGRRAAALQDIDLLENDTFEVAGCTISGATLWTDYALDGEVGRAMSIARHRMNDHRRISASRSPSHRPFRPEDAAHAHRFSRRFLEWALLGLDPPAMRTKPHIVVSHHAPSRRSIAPAYADDSLNPAFASDLDALILAGQPDLWVHGHVHSAFDYRIGKTRVVCNPLGYGRENPAFDPGLVIEVET